MYGRCDMIDLDGKPAVGPRSSYTHTQKMRASMTHMFGRVQGIGSQPWRPHDGDARDEQANIMVQLLTIPTQL